MKALPRWTPATLLGLIVLVGCGDGDPLLGPAADAADEPTPAARLIPDHLVGGTAIADGRDGAPSRVVYTGFGTNGSLEIFIADLDGSNVTNLTNDPARDWYAAVSPDGSKIAFQSNRDGNDEIYVMDIDGGNPVNLTNHPAVDRGPAWSPDGGRIVFDSYRVGNNLFVMNADGSGVVQLTDQLGNNTRPSWSPDGTRVVFESGTGIDDVWMINADGTGAVNLTNSPGVIDDDAEWSPDGSRILFSSDRDGVSRALWTMAPDGSAAAPLTGPGDPLGAEPTWSPDGSRILYSSNGGLLMLNADGSDLRWLLIDGSAPDWVPAS